MRVTIIILAALMVLPEISEAQILPWRRRVSARDFQPMADPALTSSELQAVPAQTCVGGNCFAGAQEVTTQYQLQRSIQPESYSVPVSMPTRSVPQYQPPVSLPYTLPTPAVQYPLPTVQYTPPVVQSRTQINYECIIAEVLRRMPAGRQGPPGPPGAGGSINSRSGR